MKGKFKLFSIFLFLAMIFSFFVSSQNVFAAEPINTEGYKSLEFTGKGISGISKDADKDIVTVSYANGNTVTVEGPGLLKDDSNNKYCVYYQLKATDVITIKANPNEGYTAELKKVIKGQEGTSYEVLEGASFSFDISTAESNPSMTFEATFTQTNTQEQYKQIEISSHAYSECGIVSMDEVSDGNSVAVNFANGNKILVERSNSSDKGLYSYKDTNGGTTKYFIRGTGNVQIRLSPADGYSADLCVDGKFQHGSVTGSIDDEKKYEVLFKKCVPYFVWLDNDGNLCYHKFLNFTGVKPYSSYDMNYVNINELTDENDESKHYTFGQQPAGWVLAKDMEDAGCSIKSDLTKEYIFGNGQDNTGVVLDSCGAVNGTNSICTNGGGNFKATIYRDGYQPLQIYEGYYFPDCWDSANFSSIIDISGTTLENPAVFKTYLRNTNIWLFNDSILGSTIADVSPIGVDKDAVDVFVYASDSVCEVNFKSNYYDHVVFEITTENGNKYYVRVERVAFNITSECEGDNQKVLANFYYPSIDEWMSVSVDLDEGLNSCDAFDIIATKMKKDGTTEVLIVEPDADKKDLKGGRNLKKSLYTVDVDDNVEGVYFTAVKKGALDAEKAEYAGTFSGSGRGIYYNLSSKQMEYDD